MKRLIFRFLTCAILSVASCIATFARVVDATPGEFTGIKVSDDFTVVLNKGLVYSATYEVDDELADYVYCDVEKRILTIYLDEKKIPKDIRAKYKGKNALMATMKVNVTVPDMIQSIELEGKAVLSDIGGVMGGKNVNVTVTDQASLSQLYISNANTVNVKADKRCSVALKVQADKITVNQSGNCQIELEQECENSEISAAGSGTVTVKGKAQTVDLKIKGSSKAIFNGSAVNASFTCSGSSDTNASNLALESADVEMTGVCSLSEAASKKLSVSLSGGSTLTFAGNPAVDIKNIKSSSMFPAK